MTYARARLWLGITGVGSLVVLATTILVVGANRILTPSTGSFASDAASFALFVAGFVVLMVPFDLLGGFVVPRRYGRAMGSFGEFFGAWTRGVFFQSVIFFGVGMLILQAGRWGGALAALLAVQLLALLFLAVQREVGEWFSRRDESSSPDRLQAARESLLGFGYAPRSVRVVDHRDPGYTGGIVGLPGRETVVVPRRWLDELTETQLTIALTRRFEAIESGGRRDGTFLALMWTVIGFGLALAVPGAGASSVAELVTTICGFTLWSFLGLLLLPAVSRRATRATDASVIARGVDPGDLERTLLRLEGFNENEPQRSAALESIFHPVPSVGRRMQMLRSPEIRHETGAWHAARTALFLSWAGVGLLSRAVHCNVGRPELWPLLPTD